MDSLRGKLLIAPPTLVDPNFARTVVLIAAHDENGALGLVLNRPLQTPLEQISPVLTALAEPGSMLHSGGPVAPESAVVLADFRDPTLAALMIFGTVGFPSADCDLGDLANGARRARVFAGHSGWGPGQLENELAEGSWLVLPASSVHVFGEQDTNALWKEAMTEVGRRQIQSIIPIKHVPDEPGLN
jgi:putative transcriptional regulator